MTFFPVHCFRSCLIMSLFSQLICAFVITYEEYLIVGNTETIHLQHLTYQCKLNSCAFIRLKCYATISLNGDFTCCFAGSLNVYGCRKSCSLPNLIPYTHNPHTYSQYSEPYTNPHITHTQPSHPSLYSSSAQANQVIPTS